MATTFRLRDRLKDYAGNPRVGATVQATASPGIKIGPVAIHSNSPALESATADATGLFDLELVSAVGAWYRIESPDGAILPVDIPAYVPDPDDPTTGTLYVQGHVRDLRAGRPLEPAPPVFSVTGALSDFGDDPLVGITLQAIGDPGVIVGPDAVYSNSFTGVVDTTDGAGAVTLTMPSIVGLWLTISTPYDAAINPVTLAAYVPDPDDTTTGEPLPPGTVIDLRNIADENPTPAIPTPGPTPTPGYEAVAWVGNSDALLEHIADPTPHPAYDDMPDLTLIFENGLV